jgi:hypothetical protein
VFSCPRDALVRIACCNSCFRFSICSRFFVELALGGYVGTPSNLLGTA